ncbi:undecaprenyldiphospho-muramoylpentapeptide beta-N-acetylglucosaminyltransferase [bacterium]|nr:undecaprenyldiphospho-muramoylpentapeptide beta-N-acetylglucosaminyltransferase [bacterium]MBU1674738.1 undecaprenyldiphospho-muramoylpentapeptide beta-N-acetylglucosaminyltransferase [bacterium]
MLTSDRQARCEPSDEPLRLMITGGGTGGHVYPGLAVAEALRRLEPASRILFVGTRAGIEAELVPRAGFEIAYVRASGFRGLGARARLRFLWNSASGFWGSLRAIRRFRPDVVLGTGGYVSLPVAAAARLLGVPLALQEQNAVPGSTNRLLGRWARRVYLGFAEAAVHFRSGLTQDTGNPVREAFLTALPGAGEAGRAVGAGRPFRLLVFGGSRGARTLNRAAVAAARDWTRSPDMQIRLQTGRDDLDSVARAYEAADHVVVAPYIDDMPEALAWADLVVSRAGAMTLAELAAAGKPAVLVPFPHATDNHQLRNAKAREEAGAAFLLLDELCDGGSLAGVVAGLRGDPAGLSDMADASRALARPDAAMKIATDLMRLSGRLPARGGASVP